MSEQRRLLRNIRTGGFEGLAAKMRSAEWRPDFGPASPHPTAGATAIGARPFLIAYNIQLDTQDVRIAESIARAVRESSAAALPGVQAMGVFLATRNQAQVSMNLLDFTITPLIHVFDEVRLHAVRHERVSQAPKSLDCSLCLRGLSAPKCFKSKNFHRFVLERDSR